MKRLSLDDELLVLGVARAREPAAAARIEAA